MAAAPALDDLTPTGLLADAAATRRTALAADAHLLEVAVAWAHAHPRLDDHGHPVGVHRVDDHALAAHFAGIDPDAELDTPAWAGLPPVAWDAPAAFGTALDASTASARTLLRDALVLAHRLPRTWARVHAHQVAPWRARILASALAGAPDDVCRTLDHDLAGGPAHRPPRLATLGHTGVARAIDDAMLRLHPDEVETAAMERQRRHYVAVHRDRQGYDGLATLDGVADLGDLVQLDATLTELADRLPAVDQTVHASDPLDSRRAKVLGILADPAQAAALLARPVVDPDGDPVTADPGLLPAPRRRTTIVVHLSERALRGTDPVAHLGTRLTGQAGSTLVDVVAEWCNRPTHDITVLPVVTIHTGHHPDDAHEGDGTDPYRPGAALRRAVELRDRTCRFPHCARAAQNCDLDHVVPHAQGGATSHANLVALCRHHHRLKTHAGYRPEVTTPGTVHWTTPHGARFRVDADGTRCLSPPGGAPPG